MRKPHGVHMLPTQTESNVIMYGQVNGILDYVKIPANYTGSFQHIYFTSDEEIREGDVVLSTFDNWTGTSTTKDLQPILGKVIEIKDDYYIIQYFQPHMSEMQSSWSKGHSKKIVATTDPVLQGHMQWRDDSMTKVDFLGIPPIPQDFIEAYIKNYNAGTPITQVMLEMELWYQGKAATNPNAIKTYTEVYGFKDTLWYQIKLKLRERDNTVIVHKVKEDPNPYKLEVGKSYLLRHVPSNGEWHVARITRFTINGHPWQVTAHGEGIVAPYSYEVKELHETPVKERTFTEADLKAAWDAGSDHGYHIARARTSFEMNAVEQYNEWLKKNYLQ